MSDQVVTDLCYFGEHCMKEGHPFRGIVLLAADRLEAAERRVRELLDERGRLTEAHECIVRWSESYPLDVFPEPDMGYAQALLAHGGMTLDAISAYAMRHVVEGVGEISRAVLVARPT